MKRILLILNSALCITHYILAQDSTLNRNVTVEREFQPVVQSAGKINVRPKVLETTLPAAEVHYSDYNAMLSPAFNTNSLLSQPMRFSAPHQYNGYVRGGLGHTNTLFDFAYHLDDKRNSILDVYANHRAEWGRRANSNTRLGFGFRHTFSTCDLYFGFRGVNRFYTRYGRYYDGNKGLTVAHYSDLQPEDKQNIWMVDAFAGVKSNNRSDIQYKAQVGYTLFALPDYVSEHQVRTTANIDWSSDAHHVGGNVYVQNSFLQTDQVADTLFNSRHALRIEPYYAYRGRRFSIHTGVNFDVNIGRGQFLSGLEQVTFAPSPKVEFEAQIAKKWLTMYGIAQGSLSTGTLQAYMEGLPYRAIDPGITSHHVAGYTPIDAQLGFHIRPYRDLLIDIYGGYAYQKNKITSVATVEQITSPAGVTILPGTFSYFYGDYGRGKIGAAFSYHYQDIINIHLWGNYYFWQAFRQENIENGNFTKAWYSVPVRADGVYDRAAWDMGLRIDARIDKHWTLYSDNRFVGSRTALVSMPDANGSYERTLKPIVQLSLGCQYETVVGSKSFREKTTQPNLAVFFQLNNYIHRRNDIWYGYQSQGINFLLGVTYKF